MTPFIVYFYSFNQERNLNYLHFAIIVNYPNLFETVAASQFVPSFQLHSSVQMIALPRTKLDTIKTIDFIINCSKQRRRLDFGSGVGEHFKGSASQGVRRADPPGPPENFRKFSKYFLRKQQIMHYFSIFFKKKQTTR